ncbi:hypothetical protein FRC02_001207 [Tulasnella sp. 418]|nr:hypothetical protein FRC02_001207 [Tulasnella sp. 418]
MALSEIPGFIVELLQARVSMDRIEKFLEEEEVPDYVSSFKWSPSHIAPDSPRTFEKNMLGLEHCSFRWNQAKGLKEENSKSKKGSPRPELPISTSSADAEPNMPEREEETREQEGFELRDISVIFPTGKFTIVTGPSSSGKSALLMALLGEMTLQPSPPSDPMSKVYLPKDPTQIDPSTNLRNCISYCAQSPWLQHDSIKNNILFGSPMDEERYNAVLEACGLIPDLIRFEDGDETELGAQGVSLSDGQKTRVALARAVYAMTGFVILDDPLATVDIHTARHLYEKLLIGPLMANRTLILVTHHVDLVRPGAHYLVRLSNGRIDMKGTIKELEEQGILEIIAHDQGETGTNEYTPELSNDDAKATAENVDKWHSGIAAENPNFGEVGAQRKARKLVKQEARLEGRVKQKIYYTYFCDLLGTTLFLFLVALTIATKSTSVVEKLWMGVWGEQSNQIAPKHVIVSYHRMFLGLDHTVLSLYNALSSWQLSRIFLAIDGLTENQRDVSTSRYQLPSPDQHPMFYIGIYAAIGFGAALLSALSDILLFFGAIRASKILFKKISDAVIGSPIYFFNTTPTGRILNRLSRDIEIVDSPLSSSLRSVGVHIASLVVSLVTIVWLLPYFTIPAIVIAYVYYRLSYGFISAGRSLRRMESTTYSPIFAAFRDTLEGLVTLRAFSSEARFLDNLHSKVDLTTKMWYAFWMTMEFTSVERVVEYSHLPQEPSAIVESNRVPAYWPTSSANPLVEVEDLVVKYAPELPPVLHGVSFSLKSKERIGVLGRTGSGKSTLAMSLLRFVDPAAGRIIIDGVDITTIGLQDLRSRLTIIPQDPVLFSGTIRNNVDPFREHSDEEIERVLERVHLYAHSNLTSSAAPSPTPSVNERVGGKAPSTSSVRLDDARTSVIPLDTKVGAGGANFSQGQRQLISMARALLRQSNIIIMDEATSSVDLATDTLIQRTIREEFPNSLLLTVSHRIRNIIDYDRLMVLDQGNLVEFDTPFNLINKPCGLFRTMCLKSGSFDDLFQVAKEKAQGQMQKSL